MSREEAKQAARRLYPGKTMHPYSCFDAATGTDWWHLSSIPAHILTRLKDRRYAQAQEEEASDDAGG
jgi:hypothetical protein